jgi:hypothetical protein
MTNQDTPYDESSSSDSLADQEVYALPQRDSEPHTSITPHQESLERIGSLFSRYLLKRHRDHGTQY